MTTRRKVLLKTAQRIGDKIGVDWRKIQLEQFRRGMEVELEHRDVTKGNLEVTGRIAHAHLEESPRYYVELAKMEKRL